MMAEAGVSIAYRAKPVVRAKATHSLSYSGPRRRPAPVRLNGMRQHIAGFTMIEMMMVLAAIAILALMAVPSYMEKIIRDQIVEAMPLADIAKMPIAFAWAAGVPLPDDNKEAGLPAADNIVSNLVSAVQIDKGAIHITFGNRANSSIKGKILSLRPAVVRRRTDRAGSLGLRQRPAARQDDRQGTKQDRRARPSTCPSNAGHKPYRLHYDDSQGDIT